MPNSPFNELFGETEYLDENMTTEDKKNKFNNLLVLFLALIVISLTFIFSVAYFELRSSNQEEVLGEVDVTERSKEKEREVENKTPLSYFVDNFVNGIYKVDDSGGFGYIYGDSKDGAFFLGHEHTYFSNGRIVLFPYDENVKIFWRDYNRKFILLEETKEFFPALESSDFYYRNYLGQHILQDLVDDYLRNKDFIPQITENTWSWEWSFYTPKEELRKQTMQAEVILDTDTNYLSKIKLFNGDGDEVCTFEFSFERLEHLDFDSLLENYEEIEELEISYLM